MAMGNAISSGLNAQLGRELEAHLQYLSVASWFAAEGLPQLAGFFTEQAEEEHEHAMRFLRYLQDAGQVAIPAVAAPRADFESAEEAVGLALAWEEDVTRHIHALTDLAVVERDHATRVFLDWFVSEQVEETATIGELLQVVRRAGENGLLLVEEHVARRAPGADAGP